MAVDRGELITHVDWLIRPPAWVYDQLEHVIELAAAGRVDEIIELECRRLTVSDAVADWELEELVGRAGATGREPPA